MSIRDIQVAWEAIAEQIGDLLMDSNKILNGLVMESIHSPIDITRLREARCYFAQAGMKIGALQVQQELARQETASSPEDQAIIDSIIRDTDEIVSGHARNEMVFQILYSKGGITE